MRSDRDGDYAWLASMEGSEGILSSHMSASELQSVEAILRQIRERAVDSLATGLVQAFRKLS